jgi:hypothetical protein
VIRAGDLVKLSAVPSWVDDLGDAEVQEVYRFSLGRTFTVREVREEDGKLALWLEPPDHPLGEQVDILWVSPRYVRPVSTEDSNR